MPTSAIAPEAHAFFPPVRLALPRRNEVPLYWRDTAVRSCAARGGAGKCVKRGARGAVRASGSAALRAWRAARSELCSVQRNAVRAHVCARGAQSCCMCARPSASSSDARRSSTRGQTRLGVKTESACIDVLSLAARECSVTRPESAPARDAGHHEQLHHSRRPCAPAAHPVALSVEY